MLPCTVAFVSLLLMTGVAGQTCPSDASEACSSTPSVPGSEAEEEDDMVALQLGQGRVEGGAAEQQTGDPERVYADVLEDYLIGESLVMHPMEVDEFDEENDYDRVSLWKNRDQKGTWKLQLEVTVNQPADVVFKAITTPNLWSLCYPDTLRVGGLVHQPFTPDTLPGMIIDTNTDNSLLLYQVHDYVPSKYVTYVSSGYVRGARFEYNLTEVGFNRTRWVRTVHFFPTGLEHRSDLWHSMVTGGEWALQKNHAPRYLNCVKRLFASEGWDSELWNK